MDRCKGHAWSSTKNWLAYTKKKNKNKSHMSGLLPTTYEKEKIKTKQVKQKNEMGNGKWHN